MRPILGTELKRNKHRLLKWVRVWWLIKISITLEIIELMVFVWDLGFHSFPAVRFKKINVVLINQVSELFIDYFPRANAETGDCCFILQY